MRTINPAYISDSVVPPVDDTSVYSLRNANDVQTIRTRTKLYSESFLPSTIREWNDLAIQIRYINTLPQFKNYLNHDTIKVPRLYYCEERFTSQIHHSSL